MLNIKPIFAVSTHSAPARRRLFSLTRNALALLLLSIFVAACGMSAEVERATRQPATLNQFVPPRPGPVLPINPTLTAITPETTAAWNEAGERYSYVGMTTEDALSLKAWIKEIANNMRAWQSYADFWERRARESAPSTTEKGP